MEKSRVVKIKYPKIIVVAGPTASGKTSLGIELALKFNGEIISADSRQIFRRLDIGSGKVTKSEKRGVPHHLIDILDPEQKYNVYKFQQDCLSLIEDISSRGKLLIIIGGTGLYIESIVEQYKFASFPPQGDLASTPSPSQGEGWGEGSKHRNLKLIPFVKELRKNQTREESLLWSKLRSNQLGFKFRRQHPIQNYILDFYCPSLRLAIELDGGQHQENKEYDQTRTKLLNSLGIKVLRFWNNELIDNLEGVLETILQELKKPSPDLSLQGRGVDAAFQGRGEIPTKKGLRPNTLVLNLDPDREVIKLNIHKRLLERWNNQNMLGEVQNLINSGVSKTWLKSLGLEYKFITEFIEGKFSSEEEFLTKLNTESWHYAKRQITFLKRWNYAHQIQTPDQALSLVEEFLVE